MDINKVGIQSVSKSTLSIVILGFSILLFCFVFYVSKAYNIPIRLITGDPLSSFKVNPLIGVVSNIGILLWCATVTVLFFTFLLMIGKTVHRQASFLLYTAFLTLILLLDDLLMFHEYILKSIGIEEFVMYGFYVILFSFYILVYFRIIVSEQFRFLLVITFFSFGNSVFIDLFLDDLIFRILIEDGFKFMGIMCWFLFHSFYCHDLIAVAFIKKSDIPLKSGIIEQKPHNSKIRLRKFVNSLPFSRY